jgi:hypothetical protein
MPIYVRGQRSFLHVRIPKTGGDLPRHAFLESRGTRAVQHPDDELEWPAMDADARGWKAAPRAPALSPGTGLSEDP